MPPGRAGKTEKKPSPCLFSPHAKPSPCFYYAKGERENKQNCPNGKMNQLFMLRFMRFYTGNYNIIYKREPNCYGVRHDEWWVILGEKKRTERKMPTISKRLYLLFLQGISLSSCIPRLFWCKSQKVVPLFPDSTRKSLSCRTPAIKSVIVIEIADASSGLCLLLPRHLIIPFAV